MSRSVDLRTLRRRALASATAALMAAGMAAHADAPAMLGKLGRAATPAEVKAWNIDVRADFKGLPPGSGSVARGQEVWEARCENCHGTFGESNEVFFPMVGGTTAADIKSGHVAGLLDPNAPARTTLMKLAQLSTLWDYINRAMPWNQPKSLATDDVYAVTAYILNLGNIVPADFVLSDKNMAEVQGRLPNRNGMTRDHGMWDVNGKPDVQGSACMNQCASAVAITSRLPEYARNAHGDIALQNRMIGGVRGAETALPAPSTFVALAARQAPPASGVAPAQSEGLKLAQSHACLACHGIGNKIVGPALLDIHKKYAAQPKADAVRLLIVRIKSGGTGLWGNTPMPAQDHVPDVEVRTLADWIATGKFQ